MVRIWSEWLEFGRNGRNLVGMVRIYSEFGRNGRNLVGIYSEWSEFGRNLVGMVGIYSEFGRNGWNARNCQNVWGRVKYCWSACFVSQVFESSSHHGVLCTLPALPHVLTQNHHSCYLMPDSFSYCLFLRFLISRDCANCSRVEGHMLTSHCRW